MRKERGGGEVDGEGIVMESKSRISLSLHFEIKFPNTRRGENRILPVNQMLLHSPQNHNCSRQLIALPVDILKMTPEWVFGCVHCQGSRFLYFVQLFNLFSGKMIKSVGKTINHFHIIFRLPFEFFITSDTE